MSADEEWARQQLSALPRPRMPDEVRARVAAAIAAESAGTAPQQQEPVAAPTPLPRQRAARRRPVLTGLIGAAAALTLFAVIDPLGVPTDSTIAGEADSETAQSGDPDPEAGAALLATQTSYTRSQIESQARRTARQAAAGRAPGEAVPPVAPSVGAALNDPGSARDCAAAIPDPQGSLVFIDRAVFEGEPALIVAFSTGDRLDIVVQDASCTRIDPAVQYRVTVDAPRAGE